MPAKVDYQRFIDAADDWITGRPGTVVLAFLVIPGIIYLRPALPGEAGLSFIVAMLVLPLIPAVLLGLTAVWSMRESRRR